MLADERPRNDLREQVHDRSRGFSSKLRARFCYSDSRMSATQNGDSCTSPRRLACSARTAQAASRRNTAPVIAPCGPVCRVKEASSAIAPGSASERDRGASGLPRALVPSGAEREGVPILPKVNVGERW